MKNKVIVNRYIKEVSSLIVADSKTKKKFTESLKSDIYDFLECNEISEFEALYERFGTPEMVAKSFWSTADLKEIKKRLWNKKVIIAGVISVVIVFLVACTLIVLDNYTATNGYYIKEYYYSEDDSIVNLSYYDTNKEKQWEIPLGDVGTYSKSFGEWEVNVTGEKTETEITYNIISDRKLGNITILKKEFIVTI